MPTPDDRGLPTYTEPRSAPPGGSSTVPRTSRLPTDEQDARASHHKKLHARDRMIMEPEKVLVRKVGAAGFEPATARVSSACEKSPEPSTCNDRSNCLHTPPSTPVVGAVCVTSRVTQSQPACCDRRTRSPCRESAVRTPARSSDPRYASSLTPSSAQRTTGGASSRYSCPYASTPSLYQPVGRVGQPVCDVADHQRMTRLLSRRCRSPTTTYRLHRAGSHCRWSRPRHAMKRIAAPNVPSSRAPPVLVLVLLQHHVAQRVIVR